MNVRFQKVSKLFGSSKVVDNLDLDVEEGEFAVLLGPSGCGKTTTLRMLAGLEEATSGNIFIGDQRVNDIPTRYRDVAMVFQTYALYPHMTVADNIAYPLVVRKTPPAEIAARVHRVAEMLEIGALIKRKPRELSGGERQRVALARAIVREPRVYLMDEPLSNLDAKLRVQMRGELKRLQRDLGTTTIYVTHDQAEAMTLAHRVAVMRAGKLQQFDTPLNIYNRPANRFVAEFVGSPSMNFLDARIDGNQLLLDASGIIVGPSHSKIAAGNGDRRVTLGMRPEHIRVSSAEIDGWLPAEVYVTELMGNETFVFLKLGGEKIIARAPAEFRAEMESRVWLQFDFQKALFFDSGTGDAISLPESAVRT
ncbi:MAG TPA: ABC transporter ATP-binding protein [Blastocatellia bacterium]|nr:ABC transporter ATP-binding protein [Blastocatellia bacterium]